MVMIHQVRALSLFQSPACVWNTNPENPLNNQLTERWDKDWTFTFPFFPALRMKHVCLTSEMLKLKLLLWDCFDKPKFPLYLNRKTLWKSVKAQNERPFFHEFSNSSCAGAGMYSCVILPSCTSVRFHICHLHQISLYLLHFSPQTLKRHLCPITCSSSVNVYGNGSSEQAKCFPSAALCSNNTAVLMSDPPCLKRGG